MRYLHEKQQLKLKPIHGADNIQDDRNHYARGINMKLSSLVVKPYVFILA